MGCANGSGNLNKQTVAAITPKKKCVDRLMSEYMNKCGFLPTDVCDLMQFAQENGFQIDSVSEAEAKLNAALKKQTDATSENETKQGFGSRRVLSDNDNRSEDENEDIDLEYHCANDCALTKQKVPFREVTDCVNKKQAMAKAKSNRKRRRSQLFCEDKSIPDLENIDPPPTKKCRI